MGKSIRCLARAVLLFLFSALAVGCIPVQVVESTATSSSNLSEETIQLSPSPFMPAQPTSTANPTDIPPTSILLPPTATATLTPEPTRDDRRFTVDASVADVWDDPANEGSYWSRQTQLVTGERVLVFEQRGEWARIAAIWQASHKDEQGYPGWVRTATLTAGWSDSEVNAVVMVPQTVLRQTPELAGDVIQPLYLDVRLPVLEDKDGWVALQLPRGEMGWLPESHVRLVDDRATDIDLAGMWVLAESMTGSPYLWGGTSPAAFDCSGFIYRLYHAFGITLPRDADDQAAVGMPIQAYERQRGDLIFTSEFNGGAVTHVVMVWDEEQIIDASYPLGLTIRPLSALLEANSWVNGRRIQP